MLVIDAGCLFEVIAGTENAAVIRDRWGNDEQWAPHLVDAEVFGVIRKWYSWQRLDATAARQAVEDLHDWPGRRVGHQLFLPRAWELTSTVRAADALYVALAEVLEATLLTTDGRLARAPGPRCTIEVVPTSG